MQVKKERWIRTYRIVRVYKRGDRHREVIRSGLTEDQAREWVQSEHSSSRTARSNGARITIARRGEFVDFFEPEVDENGKVIRFSARV